MDYTRGGAYPGSNAIAIIPDADPPDWATIPPPQSVDPCATISDDYDFADTPPSRSGSEQPSQSRKPRSDSAISSSSAAAAATANRAKAIGRMFFKTKLCCKFRAGTCPYPTNCNFAHGIEELRKPPPNWEEIVASHNLENSPGAVADIVDPPREEHQIPIITTSTSNTGDGGAGFGNLRSYKGRHCKKFYTEDGCPYGDMCTFLHDEQSRARESVAINLSPVVGGGGGHGNNVGSAAGNQKPSNWKTRICNKWEMTGYCPFGSKCHFAHGAAELHNYAGGLVEADGKDASSNAPDPKQGGTFSKAQTESVVGSTAMPYVDIYHMGVPSHRSVVNPRQGQRPIQKWKGPDKISRIYGDWIDDIE